MAIAKKTIVDQIEWTRRGAYQIRLALVIDEDGDEIERKWHRTLVWNSGEVDTQMAAVNANLITLKADTLGPAQITRIKNIIQAVEGVVGWKEPPAPPVPLQPTGQTP